MGMERVRNALRSAKPLHIEPSRAFPGSGANRFDLRSRSLIGRSFVGPPRSVSSRRDVARRRRVKHGGNAEALEISEDNVKVRLHRGRAMVRGWLFQRVGAKAKDAFPFMGARCDRVVHNVFARLF